MKLNLYKLGPRSARQITWVRLKEIAEVNGVTLQRKKTRQGRGDDKQLREQKKTAPKIIAKKNGKSILLSTFDFDPEEYLDKSLLFNLKKTSKEKIFDAILEKIPNNDSYYIKYREGTSAFRIRKDKKTSGKRGNY